MPLGGRRCRSGSRKPAGTQRFQAMLVLVAASWAGSAEAMWRLQFTAGPAGHEVGHGGRHHRQPHAPFNDTVIKNSDVGDSYMKCREDKVSIAINHYKEEPGDVRRTIKRLRALFPDERPCVHVYTKGPLNATEIKARLRVGDFFYQVENIGREGHTWLLYILQHYHRLAGHVLFSQALPHGDEEFFERATEAAQHYKEDSFACLGGKSTMYKCDRASILGRTVRLREIWAMTQHRLCPPLVHVCYRGQFLVSNASIHKQPRRFYHLMKQYLEAGPAHWIHEDLEEIDKTEGGYKAMAESKLTRDNTLFGHVLERMWMAIFDCQERTIRADRQWACAAEQGHGELPRHSFGADEPPIH